MPPKSCDMTDTSTAVRPTKIALKAGENLWKLSRKVFKKFFITSESAGGVGICSGQLKRMMRTLYIARLEH